MLKIYIARHGQNEDNANGILNGHRDLPLTDIGRKSPDASPQLIAVNSAVNAVCGGNREDAFRFLAKKGQRVVIECQAGTPARGRDKGKGPYVRRHLHLAAKPRVSHGR